MDKRGASVKKQWMKYRQEALQFYYDYRDCFEKTFDLAFLFYFKDQMDLGEFYQYIEGGEFYLDGIPNYSKIYGFDWYNETLRGMEPYSSDRIRFWRTDLRRFIQKKHTEYVREKEWADSYQVLVGKAMMEYCRLSSDCPFKALLPETEIENIKKTYG